MASRPVVSEYTGTFRLMGIGRLHIDVKYQRGEQGLWAERIAENFSWPFFGALVVSRRKGAYYVVDGQHRALAAALRGIEEVPCLVFEGLELKDEAASFVNIQRRKPISPVTTWKANLVAEEPNTVGAQTIMARYGFAVASKMESGSHTITRSAGLMLRLYQYGELVDVLHFLTACWPKHRLIGSAAIIRAVAGFLQIYRSNPSLSAASMMERFKDSGPDHINQKARGLLEYGSSSSMVNALVLVMTQVYNKGLRGSRKLTP